MKKENKEFNLLIAFISGCLFIMTMPLLDKIEELFITMFESFKSPFFRKIQEDNIYAASLDEDYCDCGSYNVGFQYNEPEEEYYEDDDDEDWDDYEDYEDSTKDFKMGFQP